MQTEFWVEFYLLMKYGHILCSRRSLKRALAPPSDKTYICIPTVYEAALVTWPLEHLTATNVQHGKIRAGHHHACQSTCSASPSVATLYALQKKNVHYACRVTYKQSTWTTTWDVLQCHCNITFDMAKTRSKCTLLFYSENSSCASTHNHSISEFCNEKQ
jgi:hypothetical protein